MWILFSLGAAFFAGITTVFGKVGVKDVSVNLATAIRTTMILIFCFVVVLIIGSFNELNKLNLKIIIFLVLSGISTALLWLSYFKALQLGDVNKITPVDKTSIILTLLLSSFFLGEKITVVKVISMILILLGTVLMVTKKDNQSKNNKWFLYAIATAIFTSVATIVGKIGIKDIESNLGMLIRTIIIFIIIWSIVFIKKEYIGIKKITKKGWLFITLSGISTGFSWLCYFKALQLGEASIVFSIEKLSIVVAVLFSIIFLKEKLKFKGIIGLIIIIIGELLLIFQ